MSGVFQILYIYTSSCIRTPERTGFGSTPVPPALISAIWLDPPSVSCLEDLTMQAFIGAKLLASQDAQAKSRPFEISDRRLPGFTLRVKPTGVRSYYARFGRNGRIALGKVGTLPPAEAGEKCRKVLGNVAVAMSLRYAHLAPDQRSEAVGKTQTRGRFLRLRCAYRGPVFRYPAATPLKCKWKGRDSNPRPRHYELGVRC